MATRDELEALNSKELHDRATRHALRHANVKFFWRLMEALPVAEASVGEFGEAHDDIQSVYGRFDDLSHSGEPGIADALRPLYIEYLLEHPSA